MDLEYKSPKLESFYSPNHRPVSPIWTEKDKGEDDNDAANTSDGEDQSSVQGNDMENNIDDLAVCDESDGLVWNDGVGTLVGSDLKFRMNSHGDIELIMDDYDLPCIESIKDKDVKEGQEVTTGTHVIPDEEDLSDRNCPPSDVQTPAQTESSASLLTSQEIPASGEQNSSPEKDENPLQIADDCFTQENAEELGVSDPVLKEDTGGPLYDVEYSKEDGSFDLQKLKDGATNTSGECDKNATPMCEVCGLPARLGNRFCSRQCLGRHAAFKRRTNQIGVSKKGKGIDMCL